MRDLSWQFFTLTGSVDAYLLYKDYVRLETEQQEDNANPLSSEDTFGDNVH